jgi:hypothetical protein
LSLAICDAALRSHTRSSVWTSASSLSLDWSASTNLPETIAAAICAYRYSTEPAASARSSE